ncbi:MAG TPA: NUDIX hydrolase [Rubrivivax sp.]|nr:NUDIX hydrolase [Rubrivivax sp.]
MPTEETQDKHLVERRLGSKLLHEGFLELRRDDVQLPDGQAATREYVRHGGAVAVIALLDADAQGHPDPHVVLARQYRYPVAKVLLELPAGKLETGEAQLACAVRELQEETGYTAAEWAYGGEIHNAAAYSTESIWLWFARGLQAGPTQLDEGEFVETVQLPLTELLALSCGDALPDVKTQIGISWLVQWRSGQRHLSWHAVADHPDL